MCRRRLCADFISNLNFSVKVLEDIVEVYAELFTCLNSPCNDLTKEVVLET